MRKVYKYTLTLKLQSFKLPKGAKILSVINQYEEIVLYALVDPDEKSEELRKIGVYGTGHEIRMGDNIFIGTVSLAGGTLVFHVFEEL